MNTDEQLAREELDRTQRLNAKLAFENDRLRKALEPFSYLCDYIEVRDKDKKDLDTAHVTFAHLRAARAALKETSNG